VLTNSGTIIGGMGGETKAPSAPEGGAAVYVNGGTLMTTGTLIGGAGGAGGKGGPQGPAVAFGSNVGTLIITPNAVLSGAVLANTSVEDVLGLGGATSGTLTGLGTQYVGFSSLTIEAGADWTVTSAVKGESQVSIGHGAQLTLDDAVNVDVTNFEKGGGETLTLGIPADVSTTFSGFGTGDIIDLTGIQASTLSYAGGMLTLLNSTGSVVDTLLFTGNYKKSDFALQRQGNNTELLYAGKDDGIVAAVPGDFLTGGLAADLVWGRALSSPNAAVPLEHDHPVSLLSFGAPSDLPVALWDHAGAS
jgi:hypothetical protein